jgi:hypothetical protein
VLLNLAVITFVDGSIVPVSGESEDHGQIWEGLLWAGDGARALGMVAEIGALYILLAAGTNNLPRRFRMTRYKQWMRTVLAPWWRCSCWD